jgi:hypothetical protein
VNAQFEATDSDGYRCLDGGYDYGYDCGYYDDVDFTANLMCCGCGGGFTWNQGSFDQEWDASAPYCYDDMGNGQLNSAEKSCGAYHSHDESVCPGYDDTDFTASEMCCACGGGDTRICENTDNGAKNSHGMSCIDVTIINNHGFDICTSDYDTSTTRAAHGEGGEGGCVVVRCADVESVIVDNGHIYTRHSVTVLGSVVRVLANSRISASASTAHFRSGKVGVVVSRTNRFIV